MSDNIRVLGATALLASGCIAMPAVFADSGVQFDLPAQTLEESLRAIGKRTGTNILINRDLVKNHQAPALNAWLTVDEALTRLLSGSGLRHRFVDERTVVLSAIGEGASRDGARSGFSVTTFMLALLSPFTAFGAAPASGTDGEGGVIETVNVFATLEEQLSVGSKSGGTLRETPKSVTIVTGERIEAQNLTSLQEVLIQTTGVTVGAFNPLETFYYARGIRLETLQFDGGAPAYTGGLGFYYTPDTATIERVEMLRGVDGMYSGAGEPGGVINLVRKRPEQAAAMRVSLSGGTWDNYRAILDGTGALGFGGRLRGRAVASYMDRGYHQDRYTTEKQILYGTLEFDATESTLLAVGVNYEKRDDEGFPAWGGLPRYSDGRTLELPRSYSTAPPWARWNFETTEAFARVEQRYGETGVIRLNMNQIEQDSELSYATIFGAVNPTTLAGSRIYAARSDFSAIQRMADLSASGKFELFGRTHSYTVGTDYAELNGGETAFATPGLAFADNVPINYFSYDPYALAEPAADVTGYYPKRVQSQQGFYATVGVQLAEPLRLTLGGRYGKFKYDQAYFTIANANNPDRGMTYLSYDEQEFIPSAALSYSLSSRWTAYLSYGETFKAQGNLLQGPPPGGAPLAPIVGDNLELGIKGDVFQGVTAAASIYRLTRDGQGAADPAYGLGSPNLADGSRCCYIQQGKITVEGLDLEMSGQVSPGWQVFGGYTFTQTDYVGNPTGRAVLGRTPKHQLKVWNTYRLPGRFSAFTVNAGVTSQSEASYGLYRYDAMTLWNASVQYALNDNWALALNGDNLTDKVYWQPTGDLTRQNIYGTPRSINISLRGHW